MATFDDVRRIALGFPDVEANGDGTEFRVDGTLFAWPWLERLDPKKARVPNLGVLNVRIASEMDKDVLMAIDPRGFFADPHFDGYKAIQVRLEVVEDVLLEKLIADSWWLTAPKRLRDRT